MGNGADIAETIAQTVASACAERQPLQVVGASTKAFYGRTPVGERLDVAGHRGIIAHEPTELVLTARAGTSLEEIEAVLAASGQMLAFEPPYFGPAATLGGAIACGLSGPRRPFAGAARDFVLGMTVVNGRGERLRFGGQVMKNVAGYDVSRLIAGSLGTLAVILDVSLKVLPAPACERTTRFELREEEARSQVNGWCRKPQPLSAAAWLGDSLYLRLSGTEAGVAAAGERLGGEALEPAKARAFWRSLREQTHPFFAGEAPLWRLSLPPAAPALDVIGQQCWDWAGAQRWLRSDQPSDRIREATAAAGGHATLFRGGDRDGEVFQPLTRTMAALHRRLKNAFDPEGILNPGRLFADL